MKMKMMTVFMTLPSLVPAPMLRRKTQISSFFVLTVAAMPRPTSAELLLHAIYSALL